MGVLSSSYEGISWSLMVSSAAVLGSSFWRSMLKKRQKTLGSRRVVFMVMVDVGLMGRLELEWRLAE